MTTATTEHPRIVMIIIDPDTEHTLREEVGSKEYDAAIGYLSTWNLSFPTVQIYCTGSGPRSNPELLAIYSYPDGTRGYTIGAVWHGDHFGFHS